MSSSSSSSNAAIEDGFSKRGKYRDLPLERQADVASGWAMTWEKLLPK